MKSNVKAKLETAYVDRATRKIYNPEIGDMTEVIDESQKLNASTVWSGEPNPKYKWTKYEWLFLPLSWFIFFAAIFWMVALKEVTYLYVFAVLLLLIGIYCIFFRNHHKKKKRMKYSYEITETDITIVYTRGRNIKVRQLPLENLKYISYHLRKNNVGTLYFNFPNDYKDVFTLIFANSGLGKFDEQIYAFFEISDADDLIEQLKAKFGDTVLFEKI